MNDTLNFAISGWIIVFESDTRRSDILMKCCRNFIKAFLAEESSHRSSKSLISNPDGYLVRSASIAFCYKGSYQGCHAFRTALQSFCSIYHLTLDRGFDIVLVSTGDV